jgi:hypothetical protein
LWAGSKASNGAWQATDVLPWSLPSLDSCQSRGTFSSVQVLIRQIRDYIDHWNTDARPFTWTATADEILAKVQLVQATVRHLVANNTK